MDTTRTRCHRRNECCDDEGIDERRDCGDVLEVKRWVGVGEMRHDDPHDEFGRPTRLFRLQPLHEEWRSEGRRRFEGGVDATEGQVREDGLWLVAAQEGERLVVREVGRRHGEHRDREFTQVMGPTHRRCHGGEEARHFSLNGGAQDGVTPSVEGSVDRGS